MRAAAACGRTLFTATDLADEGRVDIDPVEDVETVANRLVIFAALEAGPTDELQLDD